MPKYSYRLRDEHGGLKTGVLEALDHRLAREDLIAKGWRVEELTPADPSAPAQPIPTPPAMVDFSEVFNKKPEEPAPAPTVAKSGRAALVEAMEAALAEPTSVPARAPVAKAPPASAAIAQATRQLPPPPQPALAPAPAWRLPVILTLIVVGLVVWIYQGRVAANSRVTKSPQPALHDVKVVVKGRLRLSDVRGRPRGARVTLHLPQIPLDVTREGDELTLNDEGDFQIELAFQSARVPSQVEVSASKDGYKEAHVRAIALRGEPLGADVPPIVLQPTR